MHPVNSEPDIVDAGQPSAQKAAALSKEGLRFHSDGEDVVDIETIREFIEQLREQTHLDTATLVAIREALADKQSTMQDTLTMAPHLTREQAETVLTQVFASRRHVDEILQTTGLQSFAQATADLLNETASVETRFNTFCERVEGADTQVIRSVAAEFLYQVDPQQWSLWARWMWHPDTYTGVVPLMTMNDVHLDGATPGAMYTSVCDAVDRVATRKDEFGLDTTALDGPHGTTVAMAVVHAAYVYLVLAMRLTKQFTDAIPDHEEYVRRLLGVPTQTTDTHPQQLPMEGF